MPFVIFTLSLKTLLNFSFFPSERDIKNKISRVGEKILKRIESSFY